MQISLFTFTISVFSIFFASKPYAQNAPILLSGQTINGIIDAKDKTMDSDGSYYDLYRTNLKAGQKIIVTMRSSDFEPALNVGVIDGGAACDKCVGGIFSLGTSVARYIASNDGIITIRANTNMQDEVGTYKITTQIINPKPPKEKTINFDEPINGIIKDETSINKEWHHYDIYKIHLHEKQPIQIEASSDNFDTFLSVENKGINFYLDDDNGGEGDNSQVAFIAPKAGIYTIKISSNNDKLGDYRLNLSKKIQTYKNPTPEPIKVGQTIVANITTDNYVKEDGDKIIAKEYLFIPKSGTNYWIDAKSNAFDITAKIGIYDQKGDLDGDGLDDDSGGNKNAKIRFEALDNIPRIIRIFSIAKDIKSNDNPFTLSINQAAPTNNDIIAKPLKIGDKVIINLKDGAPRKSDQTLYDLYKINLNKDDKITFEAKDIPGKKSDNYMEIGTGGINNFNAIAQDEDSGKGQNARIRFVAPQNGEYLLRVSGTNAAAEDEFILEAYKTPAPIIPPPPIEIKTGIEITSTLNEASPVFGTDEKPYKDFVFNAIKGKKYFIIQKSNDFDAYLYVKPILPVDNKFIEADDTKDSNDAMVEYEATETGKILIRASNAQNDTYGNFSIVIHE